MLSSLSSFLPNVLNGHSPSSSAAPAFHPDEDTKTDDEDTKHLNNLVAGTGKRKEKDKKTANETFIFVRPPPAKTNHPLNLQVQLVPPNAKQPGINHRQSLDFSAPDMVVPTHEQQPSEGRPEEEPLSRVSSNRSDVSAYSGYTSTASFSSVSSSATSSSTRRMIIPLYNLQAHNVMTNVIVDAGTDAKVAKFLKRGIEIVDLAVLEPVEVWGQKTAIPAVSSRPPSIHGSIDVSHGSGFLRPTNSRSRPSTPDIHHTPPESSTASLASSMPPTPPEPVAPTVNTTPVPSSKRNIFGKLFKRKPESVVAAPALETIPSSSLALATPRSAHSARHARSPSAEISSTPTQPAFDLTVEATTPTNSTLAPPPSATNSTMNNTRPPAPPVLGIQPMLSYVANAPSGRATMYVWIVRKWIKGSDNGILAGMMRGGGFTGSGLASEEQKNHKVEVRFEWKRSQKAAKTKKRKDESRNESRNGSSLGLAHGGSPSQTSLQRSPSKERKAKNRMSTLSISTAATTNENREEDDGYDSEPEDSEVPWTCTLKIKRLLVSSTMSPQPAAETIRIKVGTLSPTPHHPKVVSMLKIPFPLADIEIERMLVMRRTVGGGPTAPEDAGLIVTAEEIKDVVSCTGLWLVVREGFGGVGKVSRKGDGWRIRA